MNLRQTVVENDLRILDVATYVATKGSTLSPKDMADNPDKLMEFQDGIMKIFKDFKMRIRSGKFTLAELEEREYTRWGVTEEVPIRAHEFKLEDILSGKPHSIPDSQSRGNNTIGFAD